MNDLHVGPKLLKGGQVGVGGGGNHVVHERQVLGNILEISIESFYIRVQFSMRKRKYVNATLFQRLNFECNALIQKDRGSYDLGGP